MSQEDVDKAIDYLFPSGLQAEGARPIMKPPEDVFPAQKSTEFDYSGRPFHPFFYTNKPQYTQLMYEMAEHIGNTASFSDRMRALKVRKYISSYSLTINSNLSLFLIALCTYI